jgi:hypothetical protein
MLDAGLALAASRGQNVEHCFLQHPRTAADVILVGVFCSLALLLLGRLVAILDKIGMPSDAFGCCSLLS